MGRTLTRSVLLPAMLLLAAGAPRLRGQVEQGNVLPVRTPREFTELRGTWVLDEDSGKGHIAGLAVAHTLVISTTPFEISLIKDGKDPESYRLDGSEINAKDARTGAVLDRRHSFTLVAGRVALTSKTPRGQFTNIITDAYAATADVLTVERQLSVLSQPPGNLVTLSDDRNNRQTLVYRRSK
jgi:hypothetical protein